MDPSLKETINRLKNMEMVPINGTTALATVAIGKITKFQGMVFTLGQMVENTKENGKITICMVMVFIPGEMEESMKVIMSMTKKKDTVHILGLMGANMKENG